MEKICCWVCRQFSGKAQLFWYCVDGVGIEKLCRTAGKAYPAEYPGTKCPQASLLIGKEGR